MNLLIVTFEDQTTEHGSELVAEISKSRSLNGQKVRVQFHDKWNCLGDNIEGNFKIRRMLNKETAFVEALEWCLHEKDSHPVVVFCDYNLDGVRIQESHVSSVGDNALKVSGKDDIGEAVEFFNRGNHGLLLAAALADAKQSNIEVILSTERGEDPSVDAERLHRLSGNRVFFNAADATLRAATSQRAVRVLRNAINGFVDRRELPDPGFWPKCIVGGATNHWFQSNESQPPHNFPDLIQAGQDSIKAYLVGMGVPERVAAEWANSPGCFEALKSFIGFSAVMDSGSGYAPYLGALVFPFVLACKHNQADLTWCDHFEWQLSVSEIAPKDKTESRKLIVRAYECFSQLIRSEDGGDPNSVDAHFHRGRDGLHLHFDFGFACHRSDPSTKRNLLSKALVAPWHEPHGDSSGPVRKLLSATTANGVSDLLFASFYPVGSETDWMTRFDFKARA